MSYALRATHDHLSRAFCGTFDTEREDRLAAAIEGQLPNAAMVVPLRQIARHMLGANPSRLRVSLVRALLKSGVEDIGLAIVLIPNGMNIDKTRGVR